MWIRGSRSASNRNAGSSACAGAGDERQGGGENGRCASRNLESSEGAESDEGAGVGDAGNGLHLLADEMADVHVALDVELGENVEVAGDRVDLGGDLRLGQRARDLVGLARARI